jgi:hypothetical protein
MDNNIRKVPLGVSPKYIWDEQRIQDLKGAIERYTQANLQVPIEWVDEYNTLVKQHGK